MANIRTLVEAVALSQGLEEVQVGVYARAAREAGFLTHRGRGRHAAHMTVRDAANLLIATAAPLAKDVPTWIETFRRLPATYQFDVRSYLVDIADLKFGEALETLITLSTEARGEIPLARIAASSIKRRLRKEAEDRNLSVPDAVIEIEFRRPILSTTVRLRRPSQISVPGSNFFFFEEANISYGPAEPLASLSPDRTETVTFSHRTLAHVAKAISF